MSILEIKTRNYYCPACGWEHSTTTNHDWEIYSGCKHCSNNVLYPVDDKRDFKPTFELVCYNYDISDSKNNDEYTALKNYLHSDLWYEKNSIHVPFYASPVHEYKKAIFEHDGEVVYVANVEEFEDQYVTNLWRLFNWMEFNWDNKKIKTWFYLIQL